MSADLPQVSVIIPLFNTRQWVSDAVNSVLAQKGVNLECIVVDDGSTDGGGEMLRDKYGDKIRVHRQENRGLAGARNSGARLAKGEFLAFLDADDYWLPGKLRYQLRYLKKHSDISCVYCLALRVDENKKLIPQAPWGMRSKNPNFTVRGLLTNQQSVGLGSTILFRKSVYEQTKGFNESIRVAEDRDLQIQLAMGGFQQRIIKIPLVCIRYAKSSLSHSLDEEARNTAFLSRKHLYRSYFDQFEDQELKSLAKRQLINVYFRQFAFYLFINEIGNIEKIREEISMLLDKDDPVCLFFQNQIKYFTPLIFHSHGWPRLETFIRQLQRERELFVDQCPKNFDDKLDLLESAIWCSKFGKLDLKKKAFNYLIDAIKRSPTLLLDKRFLTLFFKFLIGIFVRR